MINLFLELSIIFINGLSNYGVFFLDLICKLLELLVLIVPLLVMVAYLTLIERKFLGGIQKRRGPNVVGIWGLLQPFADGLKLVLKENIFVLTANRSLYILAPVLMFFFSIMNWGVIPFAPHTVLVDLNLGILYLFILSSLSVWGIILAGWSSNSRYAFLGCLRSAAQMISYEVSMGIILISICLGIGSLNISRIVDFQENVWLIFPFFPFFLLFLISALAETNRPPFDLPEAEAELVSGYNVEYASTGFTLFFLGEYANIILMSALIVIVFLGGWLPPFGFHILYWIPESIWFGLKLLLVMFFFVWVRATFPRYRYDQLMRLGWKVFVPLSLGWLVLVAGFIVVFDYL